MIDDNAGAIHESKGKLRHVNTLVWIVIALVLVLIAAWTVWAGHQPFQPSIWGE